MLIAMAVYDTVENKRTKMTQATCQSLVNTVDWDRHRLIMVDNGSCDETQDLYSILKYEIPDLKVIWNGTNLGTAMAINKAWKHRRSGEHAVKMDNDVVIHQPSWADYIEEVFDRDNRIGILGLKRNDLMESPFRDDWAKSTLRMIPHEPGERWFVVEEVAHVMGTCQAYRSELLDKMGFLYQMQDKGNTYGFDDSLAAARCRKSGYTCGFLMGVHIDHIDPGGDKFTVWKQRQAGKWMDEFQRVREEYQTGKRPVYYGGP